MASRRSRIVLRLFFALALLLVTGCGRRDVSSKGEYVWVSAPEATLRDRVATIYNKAGIVHNGERVEVLERMPKKAFVRVRSPRGEEGWVQERFLADRRTYDLVQKLADKVRNAPVQASALCRSQANLHATPGRKTEHLYSLAENQKVDLLERQIADRNGLTLKESPTDSSSSDEPATPADKPAPTPVPEDWWLVRDSQKRAGWVLGRLLYVEVPIEIAQYAEGQRTTAIFKLDEAEDRGKKFSEYLVLLTENKDGLSYDFDQVRVFTWNSRAHRYETAFSQHHVSGVLPVVMGREAFGDEGPLPTFTWHVKDDDSTLHEQKFKFKSPRVQRVLAPGEGPPATPHRRQHGAK
ncbi:MAG TPA: SH3 domain-containing protein [Verrucomicrobiae bacterium]|nr:SH3 domain-containing protein [Verrucomicrobiae bacterium]